MYYHLSTPVYASYFNDQLIILDLKKNQYLILSNELSRVLELALFYPGKLKSQDWSAVQYLQEVDILKATCFKSVGSKGIGNQKFQTGAVDIDWNLDVAHFSQHVSWRLCVEAWFALCRVCFVLKFFGFYSLIKGIKRKKPKRVDYALSPEMTRQLVIALNRAAFYFPFRVKCLQWASALVLMGLKRRVHFQLNIGVQNMPFAAHAWVSTPQGVVADRADLAHELSVILSEPFSKDA